MPGVIGTPVNGGYNAAATSHVINLPTGIQAGEIIRISYVLSETSRIPVISGYTDKGFTATVDTSFRIGIMYKEATGSEGATETMTFSPAGSTALTYVVTRLEGYDASNFLNGNAGVLQEEPAAITNPTVLANAISISSGNSVQVLMACEANRSVSAYDTGLLTQVGTIASTNSLHDYIDEEVVGSGNPEYGFTINSTRRMVFMPLRRTQAA